ncbi:MAG: aminopeptidase P family protein [Deltaproteobacteria bacterium]|nr:aminopeptidase P family protein [Deltaproteobacteria bacterium]TLN01949.1 MAG: aminopeptidase P family protein [bacterium]
MNDRVTPIEELERRCSALQGLMAAEGLDAVIIVQNADLFYFTGTIQSGCLYVPVEGTPIYLVRRDALRARRESALTAIVPFSSMREVPEVITGYSLPEPKRIGMEFDVLPVSFFERYRKVFPAAEFRDVTPLIRRVRMKKSAYELACMRDAARQVDKVTRHAAETIREGMTDLDLAAELEFVARKEGHLGHIRMRVFNGEMIFGHTFSGADGAVPAYTDTPLGGAGLHPSFGQGCGRKRIRPGEPIVVDFAGSCDGYLVDQTRIFALDGLPRKLLAGHEDMLAVQAEMCRLALPGAVWGDIYEACLALAVKQGHAEHFMGYRGSQVSFIGHGVGIEIDEYPFLARGFNEMRLEAGMVFAFEPKLVYPEVGAVGIENTFHLSEAGLEQLTFSRENIVIV